MAYPGGGSHHDRDFKGLRKVVSQRHHCLGLPGGIRIQNGNFGHHGHHAAVLFGLGGVGAGIVGTDHHESALGTHVGRAHQGVRGHVEAHLLHADRRAQTAHGAGIGDLESHLFIDGPLHMHVANLLGRVHGRQGSQDFRSRRARVGRRHGAAVFQQSPGNRFIAQHQSVHSANFPGWRLSIRFVLSPPFNDPLEVPVRL